MNKFFFKKRYDNQHTHLNEVILIKWISIIATIFALNLVFSPLNLDNALRAKNFYDLFQLIYLWFFYDFFS